MLEDEYDRDVLDSFHSIDCFNGYRLVREQLDATITQLRSIDESLKEEFLTSKNTFMANIIKGRTNVLYRKPNKAHSNKGQGQSDTRPLIVEIETPDNPQQDRAPWRLTEPSGIIALTAANVSRSTGAPEVPHPDLTQSDSKQTEVLPRDAEQSGAEKSDAEKPDAEQRKMTDMDQSQSDGNLVVRNRPADGSTNGSHTICDSPAGVQAPSAVEQSSSDATTHQVKSALSRKDKARPRKSVSFNDDPAQKRGPVNGRGQPSGVVSHPPSRIHDETDIAPEWKSISKKQALMMSFLDSADVEFYQYEAEEYQRCFSGMEDLYDFPETEEELSQLIANEDDQWLDD
ncbi:hypothetical protein GNI_157930 [Gregarina niphandrodes]|uniref:Uncharacterized protein n=1 Tax=Gregarina niphandrodes TaxID=110365 RepID=A0A023AZS7_GRENI|nr:hypothetical protein GNI_157930 [Gregarina niphandrodes]EZG43810.1 hypothetical protein GNI_157930 [Gregarina niphandrodes]|eukprot:XP_011133005.1 hypothetical protein GNI_157930 [Gregarina niphandrodes]